MVTAKRPKPKYYDEITAPNGSGLIQLGDDKEAASCTVGQIAGG